MFDEAFYDRHPILNTIVVTFLKFIINVAAFIGICRGFIYGYFGIRTEPLELTYEQEEAWEAIRDELLRK